MAKITEANVIRSSLWAAYGDAIGFPTELVSASEFKKRNSAAEVSKPIAWHRRVGGMFGPDVAFPEGSYSDDTQLRLSSGRAINGRGFFDVESFAKIELPVWLNYALGAGRGSKAAAANLALRDSSWSLNFFSTASTKYWEGGGNGAAMRIQPHVWQNHAGPQRAFLSDVIRNSVCTHGHPRAIVGAIIHAALLFETLRSGEAVRPSDWSGIGETVAQIGIEMLAADPELPLVWIPSWERFAKRNLKEVWAKTTEEWVQASRLAASVCERNSADPALAYVAILKELNGFDPAERGSGLKTPLYASALAWLYRDRSPEEALASAANVFGSDTDTIATMAGALIGAIAQVEPTGALQDAKYLRSEASRLFHIGNNEQERTFEYPDLLSWNAPRNQSDAWVSDGEGERLAGIGLIRPYGPTYKPKKGTELVWQWAELDFGQTVLVKRRAAQVLVGNSIGVRKLMSEGVSPSAAKKVSEAKPTTLATKAQASLLADDAQLPLDEVSPLTVRIDAVPASPISLDALTQQCIRGGFDPTYIGNALLGLMQGPEPIERAIAFAAIIAKAKVVRSPK